MLVIQIAKANSCLSLGHLELCLRGGTVAASGLSEFPHHKQCKTDSRMHTRFLQDGVPVINMDWLLVCSCTISQSCLGLPSNLCSHHQELPQTTIKGFNSLVKNKILLNGVISDSNSTMSQPSHHSLHLRH